MSGNCLNCQIETQICEKLAEYEDAEEKEYKVQETWEEFKESVSLLTMIIIIFIGIVIITKL